MCYFSNLHNPISIQAELVDLAVFDLVLRSTALVVTAEM